MAVHKCQKQSTGHFHLSGIVLLLCIKITFKQSSVNFYLEYFFKSILDISEIEGRRNENAMMDVRSYEAGQDKKWKNKGDNESGRNRKESPGKEVEVVWASNEKRGALCRKEGDGN